MVHLGQSLLRVKAFLFLLILLAPPFCSAAESPPALTVTAMGAHLYARQDKESEMITNLEKGEQLLPVGQTIGTGLWYMVKTPKGAIGWVQSADVSGISLPEDPMTTIPGSRPVPAGAYDQPGMINQPGYQGPGGHRGPLTPEEQEAAGKNIDRQRIESRSNVYECERESAFAGVGKKRQVFENCMKPRGYTQK